MKKILHQIYETVYQMSPEMIDLQHQVVSVHIIDGWERRRANYLEQERGTWFPRFYILLRMSEINTAIASCWLWFTWTGRKGCFHLQLIVSFAPMKQPSFYELEYNFFFFFSTSFFTHLWNNISSHISLLCIWHGKQIKCSNSKTKRPK